jgi:hypothetical protein
VESKQTKITFPIKKGKLNQNKQKSLFQLKRESVIKKNNKI